MNAYSNVAWRAIQQILYHKNKWHSLQLKSKAWTGLDRFGDVHDTTSWENGPVGYYIHKSCYIKILSSVQLQKA